MEHTNLLMDEVQEGRKEKRKHVQMFYILSIIRFTSIQNSFSTANSIFFKRTFLP